MFFIQGYSFLFFQLSLKSLVFLFKVEKRVIKYCEYSP